MLYLLYAYWKLTYFDGLNCSTGSNAPMAISSLIVKRRYIFSTPIGNSLILMI